jgi:Putative transposase
MDGAGWITSSPRFFLPIRVLSRVFHGKFTAALKQLSLQGELHFHSSLQELARPECFRQFLRQLFAKEWVVHAKRPFGGAEHVLHYLARYTHRVAISNHRLLAFKEERVSFLWKDYACGGKQKVMVVSADEFLRRFLIHVLPKGLVRIRHFGLFANRRRTTSLRCRALLGIPSSSPQPLIILERMTSSQLNFHLTLTLLHNKLRDVDSSGSNMIRTAPISVSCNHDRTRKAMPCPVAFLSFNMTHYRHPMNLDIPHRRRHARPLATRFTPNQRPPKHFRLIQIP